MIDFYSHSSFAFAFRTSGILVLINYKLFRCHIHIHVWIAPWMQYSNKRVQGLTLRLVFWPGSQLIYLITWMQKCSMCRSDSSCYVIGSSIVAIRDQTKLRSYRRAALLSCQQSGILIGQHTNWPHSLMQAGVADTGPTCPINADRVMHDSSRQWFYKCCGALC